jgi:hypothetical protein
MQSYVHSEPFISNELFLLYSDIQLIDKYDRFKLTTITNHVLSKCANKSKIIIFVKTEYLMYYIEYLIHFTKDYILITTCNDDYCIPFFSYPTTDNVHESHIHLLHCDKLLCWYTKNPCILHYKLKPIPLGPKWQWNSGKFFGEDITSHKEIFNEYGLDGYKAFKTGNKPNLLYFNFSVGTTNKPFIESHINIRHVWKAHFETIFQWNESKYFGDYIIELSSYKFCLSPPGRGVDTHRTWEALMVGTIPIMLSTALDPLFTTLPVIIVDSIEGINEEFLNAKYEELYNKDYDFSIVYSEYWKSLFSE